MKIIRTKNELRQAISQLRAPGKTIALVPTMGALHAGHISLVKLAQQHAQAVVATIFVNPTQFGPNEDFSRYPRTENEDIKALETVGCNIAYVPTVEEMYSKDTTTTVQVGHITEELCGAFRPGHFDGVATVVTKLFMQTQPDVAVFGEKDYQQLYIIKKLVADLDMPIKIIGAPILREEGGLAMSSRNRYLSPQERQTAALLNKILREAGEKLHKGQETEKTVIEAKDALLAGGFNKIDYIELRDVENLSKIDKIQQSARLLAAAYLGKTRLIDNLEV